MSLRHFSAVTLLLSLASLAITGCNSGGAKSSTGTGTGTGNTPPTGPFNGPPLVGAVRAGQTPITGASVQLYAVGTSGNGSQGIPMLTTPVTTDSSGAFNIAAGYSCPSAASQLYAVARGGKVGTAPTANAAITFIAPLGVCSQPTLTSNIAPQVVLNEVTTMVTAWSMAQFLAAGGNLGITSTNTTGYANALATVNSLAALNSGTAPGAAFPSTGTAPTARINSAANLLNACVVSTAACTTLFANTTVSGSPSPANTLDAALNLVRNPGANVTALYTLSGTSTAFSAALTSAPSDWTLHIAFRGGGMSSPSGIGIDSKGNVWVASYFAALSEFTPTGTPVFPSGITDSSLNSTYGLAIDSGDNIWIPNEEGGSNGIGSVTIFKNTGSVSTSFSTGGVDYPVAIASDPNGTAWVVEYGNSHVSLFNSTGMPLSGNSGYSSSAFDFPVAVALDSNHIGYIANQSDSSIVKVTPDGSQITAINCCNGASGLAVDQANNVWVANYYGDSVSEITASGSIPFNAVAATSTAISGGGIDHPQGIAVDGAGSVWVANYRGPSLTQIAGAKAATPGALLSPSAGWAPDAAMLEAFAVAIDASGNLWITNFGTPNNFPTGGVSTSGSAGSFTVTEFVGLAAPVKTPLLGPPQAP